MNSHLAYRIVNSVDTKVYAVDSPRLLAPKLQKHSLSKGFRAFHVFFEIGCRLFIDGVSLACTKFNDGKSQAMLNWPQRSGPRLNGLVRVIDDYFKVSIILSLNVAGHPTRKIAWFNTKKVWR